MTEKCDVILNCDELHYIHVTLNFIPTVLLPHLFSTKEKAVVCFMAPRHRMATAAQTSSAPSAKSSERTRSECVMVKRVSWWMHRVTGCVYDQCRCFVLLLWHLLMAVCVHMYIQNNHRRRCWCDVLLVPFDVSFFFKMFDVFSGMSTFLCLKVMSLINTHNICSCVSPTSGEATH